MNEVEDVEEEQEEDNDILSVDEDVSEDDQEDETQSNSTESPLLCSTPVKVSIVFFLLYSTYFYCIQLFFNISEGNSKSKSQEVFISRG